MKVKAGHCLSLREKRGLACRGILPLVCTLNRFAPYDPSPERFKRTVESNGDAHHTLQVTGCEVTGARWLW